MEIFLDSDHGIENQIEIGNQIISVASPFVPFRLNLDFLQMGFKVFTILLPQYNERI